MNEAPSVFEDVGRYPELDPVIRSWETIRDEALTLTQLMSPVEDGRAALGDWLALPLLPEEEDRAVVPEPIWRANQALAPVTVSIVSSISIVECYALSLVRPGGVIRPHRHDREMVTASLCLQDGGDAHLIVDGQRRRYRSGELLAFDYRRLHEVVNAGPKARIVLLMLIPRLPDARS